MIISPGIQILCNKFIFPAVCLFYQAGLSQNVGVGTASPTAKLHVVSTDSATLVLANSTSLNTGVRAELALKTGSYFTGIIGTYGTGINSSRLYFSTFASSNRASLQERLSILDNGNIGIGNTSPTHRLDVNGSIHGSNNLLVDGNVGIGNANPAAKLDVNGSIQVAGNITKVSTGAAYMLPFAYGKIAADGSVTGGSGNFTAYTLSSSPGYFGILLNDDNFPHVHSELYTIVVSLEGNFSGTISSSFGNGSIQIRTSSLSAQGVETLAWKSFNFLIFRSQ